MKSERVFLKKNTKTAIRKAFWARNRTGHIVRAENLDETPEKYRTGLTAKVHVWVDDRPVQMYEPIGGFVRFHFVGFSFEKKKHIDLVGITCDDVINLAGVHTFEQVCTNLARAMGLT